MREESVSRVMHWYVRGDVVEAYDSGVVVMRRHFVSGQDDALPQYTEYVRAQLTRELTEIRIVKESAGITTFIGPIATDRQSQAVIAAAMQFLSIKEESFPWKLASGEFVRLEPNQLREIAGLVGDHVKRCFENEARLFGQLQLAQSEEELANVNLQDGWDY